MCRDWHTMAKLIHLSETAKVFGNKYLHNQKNYRKFVRKIEYLEDNGTKTDCAKIEKTRF